MSDVNKTNEIPATACDLNEAISEPDSPWIIEMSKTHPGLKYYFNTVTRVSVWNISKEDMELAKIQKEQLRQNEFINCPEPKEPPPNRKAVEKLSAQSHNVRLTKVYNKPLTREAPSLTCDTCHTSGNNSSNLITVNVQPCSHPNYISPCDKGVPIHVFNRNYGYPSLGMFENVRSLNKNISDKINPGSMNAGESEGFNIHNDMFDENTTNMEHYDLTPLKVFANNLHAVNKWYIIADADVYLNHMSLLQAVLSADHHCCLMVPRNVKIDLENSTRTNQRTNAYFALYFIYKQFDYGSAIFDDDNDDTTESKTNTQHILDCCTKINEQNYFTVVISNNVELNKYKKVLKVPFFTPDGLKEYLRNKCVPEAFKSKNTQTTESMSNFSYNLPHTSNPTRTNLNRSMKVNRSIQTSFKYNSMETQSEVNPASKNTIDAGIQTTFSFIQTENVSSNTTANQTTEGNTLKETLISHSQSCGTALNSNNSRKHFKLKRRKFFSQDNTNMADTSTPNPNIIHNVSSPNDCKTLEAESKIKPSSSVACNKNKTTNIETTSCSVTDTKISHNVSSPSNSKTLEECKIRPSSSVELVDTSLNLRQNQNAINEPNNVQSDQCGSDIVMFEITSKLMEETLKTRYDEWVSRFVQIMEEALTQVLRIHLPLYIPPPWNIYEATVCVEKHFKDDPDIAKASKKFLNVLKCICDEKGNINSQISPTVFMEMYSYGVFLIDCIQNIYSTCEDLLVAVRSLSKLLNDIQNPDSDQLDSFNCTSQDDNNMTTIGLANQNKGGAKSPGDTNYRRTEITIHSNTTIESPRKYNLRKNHKMSRVGDTEEPSLHEDIDKNQGVICKNTFLSKFLLQRNIGSKGTDVIEETGKEHDVTEDSFADEPLQNANISEVGCNNNNDMQPMDELNSDHEPRIIRNFVMCSEFEKRLKTRYVHEELEDLNFDDDMMDRDYMDEGKSSCGTRSLHINEYADFPGDDEDDFPSECDDEPNTEYVTLNFKHLQLRIAQEIKYIRSEVYCFSKYCYEGLSLLSGSDVKIEVREKAEQYKSYISRICAALTNILNRDKNGSNNIQALLSNTEFYDIYVDRDELKCYGAFITTCLEQAHHLRDIINDVLLVINI